MNYHLVIKGATFAEQVCAILDTIVKNDLEIKNILIVYPQFDIQNFEAASELVELQIQVVKFAWPESRMHRFGFRSVRAMVVHPASLKNFQSEITSINWDVRIEVM